MSTLKFTNPEHWQRIETHLAGAKGERFAFALTRMLADADSTGPILEVIDVTLINDADTERDSTGWYVSDRALDRVHNQAVRSGTGLAEFHNHQHAPPRFSPTDERGLAPTSSYVLDLLPGRPYVTAVWAEGQVHAEWWVADIRGRRVFNTVIVLGDHLRILNTAPTPALQGGRLDRQLPLLGPAGQATLGALRVAVVGAGGTGSQVLLQLAYLGVSNVLVLDDDLVEETNLNRLVTAGAADLGRAKTAVAVTRLQTIDPRLQVTALPGVTVTGKHPELYDVDLIIGCVDHDGPRERLGRVATESATPYLDLATGVDQEAAPALVGGRVALIPPGGPCLYCLGELDLTEIARWAKPAHQQELDRRHGYGTATANPSVVHLNALTVSVAIGEVVAWISGSRPPAQWIDIDLTGSRAVPGSTVSPRRLPGRTGLCPICDSRARTAG